MTTSHGRKLALTGVRVFDGSSLSGPHTVVIDGATIGGDPNGAETLDAGGAVLLPGLIDAHIHLHDRDTLDQLAGWGVTTALDMATWPAELVASLRNVPGTTDIRSPGLSMIGPSGPHSHFMPPEAIVQGADAVRRHVADRVAEGADYIKIVLEAPGAGGPERSDAEALVDAAHAAGKQVIAHASSQGAFTLALDIGVDIVTHVPVGAPLDAETVDRMRADGRIAVPTLVTMAARAQMTGHPEAFAGSERSVAALHEAGVPILAGTDAAVLPNMPTLPAHGESLHHELELLVESGLSTVEALRAATSLPAKYFGLGDRGAVETGKRADLVLIDGDPIADIRATRRILRIWCGGIEHEPASGTSSAAEE